MKSLKPFGKSSYIPLEEALRELDNYKPEETGAEEQEDDTGDDLSGIIPSGSLTIENPGDYVQVPGVNGIHGNPVAVSKFEVQGMNNKNYENTHRTAFQLGKELYIPTPAIFMLHFKNIVETYRNRQAILDAEGNPIRREEHKEIYSHLTTNFKDVYGGNQPGAWAWLNARFISGTGFNGLDLETIIGVNADGTLKARKEPLIPCLNEDAFAEIKFNSQGFPTQKSAEQTYKQGDNIHYWKPVEGAVARFNADSGRSGLDCGRGPGYSNSALGVFLCAEGAPEKLRIQNDNTTRKNR